MEAYLGISTDKLLTAGAETIYMVCISLFIGAIIAFPLAILLYLTRKNGMYQNRFVNGLLNIIINVIRSTPFIIMLVCVMPLTKVLVGTRIGTKAALVPLTIYIAPYLARLMEGALLETKAGIIEAAEAMGATPLQIVWHFIGIPWLFDPYDHHRNDRTHRSNRNGRLHWRRRYRKYRTDLWISAVQ